MTLEAVLWLSKAIIRNVRNEIMVSTKALEPSDRILVNGRVAAYLKQLAGELEAESAALSRRGSGEMY